MANYYSSVTRAISELGIDASGEQRGRVYERARAALIARLSSVQPPLSLSEMNRERLSLEETIRKVESEAALRAREASQGSTADDPFRAITPPPSRPSETAPQVDAQPLAPPAPSHPVVNDLPSTQDQPTNRPHNSGKRPLKNKRAFISYSKKDHPLANRVRKELVLMGFSSFMAHDDIEVSNEWPRAILEELKSSTLFVALLSKNYIKSPYCMQESGIAVFRKMIICPLSLDNTLPPGFMGIVQSIRVDPANFDPSVLRPSAMRFDEGSQRLDGKPIKKKR